MLGRHDCVATIGVKDLKSSRKFYEETLGLKVERAEGEGAVTFQSGTSRILVYQSQFAGTNAATAATWTGEDVDTVVEELKSRGVAFEHYDLPGSTRKGDVHVYGEVKLAWFKDPDGNILAIVNR